MFRLLPVEAAKFVASNDKFKKDKGMILGFMGQSESGKDTASDWFVDKYGFVKIPLADPIKRLAKEIYEFTDEQLWGLPEEKNKHDLRYPIPGKGFLTPRLSLQIIGTEIGRQVYQDTWVSYTMRAAAKVLAGTHSYDRTVGISRKTYLPFPFMGTTPIGVVISDVRFINEIKCIRAGGGVIIRLKRVGKDGNIQGGIAKHASEEEQKSVPDSEVDYVIEVPEGIPAFHKELREVCKKIPALVKGLK